MPKYLIVGKVDGAAFTLFNDDYMQAVAKMAEIQKTLDGYTELYERKDEGYVALRV